MVTGWRNKWLGWTVAEDYQQVWETLTQWIEVASWWSSSVTGRGRNKRAGDLSTGWARIQCLQVRHGETRECGIYWVNRDALLFFSAQPGLVMACRRTSTICDWFVLSFPPSLPNLFLSWHTLLHRYFNVYKSKHFVFPAIKLWWETYLLN